MIHSRKVLPFWQYCRNKHFDQNWYFGQNWYFCQIDIFVKIDIFIKIDIFVKIDNSVKIVFLTISSTVFDDFINYRQLYQLLIFSSTIWSKYQMSVPVNCNFAKSCFWQFHQLFLMTSSTIDSYINFWYFHQLFD